MNLKAVVFTHTEGEFGDRFELRDWLSYTLREARRGWYHLRDANGLGKIGAGTLVFFNRDDFVVGFAVAETDLVETTEDDVKKYGEKYKYKVKFVPESIWAFAEDHFIPRVEVEDILDKKIRQGYPEIDTLDQLLLIFNKMLTRVK
jgi:hypothetical protein